MIYLDYAAAGPVDERVLAAMLPYYGEHFFNPSAAYTPARAVKAALNDARHRLAMCIGGKQSEIILTAGATESIFLGITGVLQHYGGRLATTPIEHAAVQGVAPADSIMLTVDHQGSIKLDQLKVAVTDDVTLVSIGYANSELGTIQPLGDIARILENIRTERRQRGVTRPLFFHTDASQAAGLLDLSISRLGVDLMTLNAGKCGGPKQVGLLWVRGGIELAPLIKGGGQERGLRGGTENVAGAVGFAMALELAGKRRKALTLQLEKLRDRLQIALQAAFPDLIVNGNQKKRLASHLHISLPGLDGERAVFALDMKGVCAATGSACAANHGLRSPVLTGAGMSPELADGSLRFSLGPATTEAEIDQAAEIIIATLKQERELS